MGDAAGASCQALHGAPAWQLLSTDWAAWRPAKAIWQMCRQGLTPPASLPAAAAPQCVLKEPGRKPRPAGRLAGWLAGWPAGSNHCRRCKRQKLITAQLSDRRRARACLHAMQVRAGQGPAAADSCSHRLALQQGNVGTRAGRHSVALSRAYLLLCPAGGEEL
jgi:hypothetical protein